MATPVASKKSGILPTPPLPADLPPVELTENARQVLARRYVRRGQDGNPAESVEEMFWRVAYHVAKVEEGWNGDAIQRAREFYALLGAKKFFPNSPTFTGAGTPLGQLAACFGCTAGQSSSLRWQGKTPAKTETKKSSPPRIDRNHAQL